MRVFINNVENGKHSIRSRREKILIILRHSESFYRKSMGLNLKDLLPIEVNDLN